MSSTLTETRPQDIHLLIADNLPLAIGHTIILHDVSLQEYSITVSCYSTDYVMIIHTMFQVPLIHKECEPTCHSQPVGSAIPVIIRMKSAHTCRYICELTPQRRKQYICYCRKNSFQLFPYHLNFADSQTGQSLIALLKVVVNLSKRRGKDKKKK